jgi:predicted enzyme related to lactoylglutathione lyase
VEIKKIGAIFLRVSSLDNSIDFYQNQLGLTLRDVENWGNERQANFFVGENGPLLLTLIESDRVQVLEKPIFNLVAANATNMYKSLKGNGHKVTDLEEWTSEWNHHIYFDLFDPDGHALNIIEMQPVEQKV